jgi:ABC-type transport system involved in multi-copper enzyme maturation permease subunit
VNFPAMLPFAIVIETAPYTHSEWWSYLTTFLQNAGGFALLGVWIWLLVPLIRALSKDRSTRQRGVPVLVLAGAVLALILYGVGGIASLIHAINLSQDPDMLELARNSPEEFDAKIRGMWYNHAMSAGGLLALLTVFLPFIKDCTQLSARRIGALTRLTFLEAVRRRVLWGFLIILVLFLFPPKWFLLIKPEDEIRINISLIHTGVNLVLLLAAVALAAFSIPTDIRNQTIHTIVTKPVQKFEIVLGRFLGFLGLLTLVMVLVFAFGLLMLVSSRISPEARAESMKARVPIFGELRFQGPPGSNFRGESVGREWEYRRYVPGGVASPYRALWYFLDLDRGLVQRDWVDCEFAFDIFRTTKGEENRAVEASFFVFTHHVMDDASIAARYQERTKGILPTASPTGNQAERRAWSELEKIVGELGYYEFRNKPVTDYHTDSIPIPRALFVKALEGEPKPSVDSRGNQRPGPRVVVSVRCDSRTQYLGVAKYDLYLLSSEGNFYWNYFKGAAGIWLRLCLMLGVAITCSTYLNGLVSFLVTGVLALLGFFRMFIILMVAAISSDLPNPGPADSLRKLISNESLGAAPDTLNPTYQAAKAADDVFRWTMRRVINVIPNMERFTWSDFVADGFSVPNEDLFWCFLETFGYLSLWAVLGHYLIKWREVATW